MQLHTKTNVQRIYLGRQIYGQEKEFCSQTQHFTIIANKNGGRKLFCLIVIEEKSNIITFGILLTRTDNKEFEGLKETL